MTTTPIRPGIDLHLDDAQAQALLDLLTTTLHEMTHEIAATDSPRFRQELKARRDALLAIQTALTAH